jgi:hypothetical protein
LFASSTGLLLLTDLSQKAFTNKNPTAALAALNITASTAAPNLPPMEIEEDAPVAQNHQGITRLIPSALAVY